MKLLTTIFNALIVSILMVALLVALVVVLYLLKILLTELFDGYGVEEFVLWLKNIGATARKKKKTN